MSEPGSEVPDDDDLTDYYDRITELCEDVEPVLEDPLAVAKRYYVEDNRPVLYDPEERRE